MGPAGKLPGTVTVEQLLPIIQELSSVRSVEVGEGRGNLLRHGCVKGGKHTVSKGEDKMLKSFVVGLGLLVLIGLVSLAAVPSIVVFVLTLNLSH
jgi:hypothetical protein